MNNSDFKIISEKVGRLSSKMRLLKALQSAGSETSELKDREILLLELLGSQGPVTVTVIRKYFPNIAASTISADLKKLRIDLGYIKKRLGIEDERTHLVELTPKGLEKVREISEKRLQMFKPIATSFQERPNALDVISDFLDLAVSKVDQALGEYGWSDQST